MKKIQLLHFLQGHFVIMKDMKGVTYVCDYILDGKLDGSHGSKEEFPKNMRCILDYLVCRNSDLVKFI